MNTIFFLKFKNFYFLGLLLVVFGLFSCKKDQTELINKKVADAVLDFKEKKAAECRAGLLAEAEKIVDSLLLNDARSVLGDSLFSRKPVRPAKPDDIPPIDSLSVKPLFQ